MQQRARLVLHWVTIQRRTFRRGKTNPLYKYITNRLLTHQIKIQKQSWIKYKL